MYVQIKARKHSGIEELCQIKHKYYGIIDENIIFFLLHRTRFYKSHFHDEIFSTT